ncbi:hypothetical protein H5410_028132 [Solanum commersonii]|uniref:Uncharacterized protein n=1 Tax=Solanum commersonii TaxID=4109 RepID=A0A9J5Z3X9_SOLCO|nr:hypothetical protein H5410_028132 [Solanum commersonii]
MINALFSNIRGVRTKKAIHRLKSLVKRNNIRFLNSWIDQPDFYDVVEKEWRIHVKGYPMWIMQQKLKNLSKKLSVWSKDTI